MENKENLPEGVELAMDLPILEDNAKVRVTGKVMRAEPDPNGPSFLLGVQFTDVGTDQRRALDEFIEKLQR